MARISSRFWLLAVIAVFIFLQSTSAMQRTGGGGTNTGRGGTAAPPQPRTPTPDTSLQPTFIFGKVLLDGGNTPPEPVIIERVCSGTAHREGYTDSKGQFQFQLGQNPGFQDASESDVSLFPGDRQTNSKMSQDARRMLAQGCEFRAVLPGFQSSTVMLKLQGNSWNYDVGTIFLKRMDSVQGATISMTTMNAPKDAKSAYEKAEKAFAQNKFSDAEKELNKAVQIYPNFAAAWSLLGNIHQDQNRLEEAIQNYNHALAADPQFVNPAFGLGLIAMQEKRWQEAAQFTSQVSKLNAPAFPSAYFYNAVSNYNLGKFDLAEESARKFKTLDTEHRHPDICLLLGEILTRKQDYAGAAQEMRDFLTISPNAPNAQEIKAKAENLEGLSLAKKQ